MKNNPIFLQFDFKSGGAQSAPLFFSQPLDVVTTHDSHAIEDCFNMIQHFLDQGYYAAGYASFELAYTLNNLPMGVNRNQMPLIWFGIFEAPKKLNSQYATAEFQISPWHPLVEIGEYTLQSQLIQKHIQQNAIREINYTIPFQSHFKGDSYTYYRQLKSAQKASYCAYLSTNDFNILSASPELFFDIDSKHITMRPMKGTIHRGLSAEADLNLKNWLRSSQKNKIENQLTIDLMKQEMRKVTQPHTIEVKNKYAIEQYPTLYQMTSTLEGELLETLSMTDVFKQLFPCSSIAGVPKKTSLELIQSLEKKPREVYCGAIGYFTPNQSAVFNVPIRTVWMDKHKNIAHYGAGGGITAHSKIKEEYNEVFTKTKVLNYHLPHFQLIETIGLFDGNYFILDDHLKRLQHSVDYFNWDVSMASIRHTLESTRKKHPTGDYRVKLSVNQEGEFNLAATIMTDLDNQNIQFATKPIATENLFLYHKTTYREMFKHKNQSTSEYTLFWNEKNEVTEFAIGNVVVEINGVLFTPPISSGLLPGTFRAKLIDEKKVHERIIYKEEVRQANHIWLINSVRKWKKLKFAK